MPGGHTKVKITRTKNALVKEFPHTTGRAPVPKTMETNASANGSNDEFTVMINADDKEKETGSAVDSFGNPKTIISAKKLEFEGKKWSLFIHGDSVQKLNSLGFFSIVVFIFFLSKVIVSLCVLYGARDFSYNAYTTACVLTSVILLVFVVAATLSDIRAKSDYSHMHIVYMTIPSLGMFLIVFNSILERLAYNEVGDNLNEHSIKEVSVFLASFSYSIIFFVVYFVFSGCFVVSLMYPETVHPKKVKLDGNGNMIYFTNYEKDI